MTDTDPGSNPAAGFDQPRTGRPGTVTAAVVIQLLLGLYTLGLGAVLLTVGIDLNDGEFNSTDVLNITSTKGLSDQEVQDLGTTLIGFGIVFVVLAALLLVLALVLLRARNWARLTATVFLVITAVVMGIAGAIGWIGAVAAIAVLGLLWLGEATRFFRPSATAY